MTRYRLLHWFIAFVVILYFSVANSTWAVAKTEIFPIASWSLFTRIPNVVTDYGVQIHAIDGRSLDSPQYIQDLPQTFEDSDSIVLVAVVEQLGEAIESRNNLATERLLLQMESEYFPAGVDISYEVHKRSYDPTERWKTGDFESIEVLSSHQTGVQLLSSYTTE